MAFFFDYTRFFGEGVIRLHALSVGILEGSVDQQASEDIRAIERPFV